MVPELVVDGSPLHIESVVAVARQGASVSIAASAHERMAESAAVISELDRSGDPVYGVTTGFGALADRAVSPHDRLALQRAVVVSHAAGAGAPLPAEVVRAMMLLRLRTLCAGRSGVRPEVAEALAALLTSGVLPWVPAHGSLGASGDLAPLAHIGAVLLGEGWVRDGDARRPAAEVLQEVGLQPLQLGPKEGLALINGTDGMAAVLSLAVHDLAGLLDAADCACAMSVEALLATPRAFAADVVGLRPSAGQARSAATLRNLLEGSPLVAAHRESHHAVQDAYSLRCAPQVHGAARDALDFCTATVGRELASIVDNPVVVDGELVSAGNFHGQALAYAADLAASVCADVAAIAERRVDRLLDPARSRGLPPFLSPQAGLNSGFMIAQYTAAALVTALRQSATPFAVTSMSTSAGQEDHVSMGWEAALRTRDSVERLRVVLAVELLCAAQALELRAPLRPGPKTATLLAALRERVPPLHEDRVLSGDIDAVVKWLREGGAGVAAGAAGAES